MSNLQLIKSERFGEITADIYSNGNDMFMTINQLAECLGYANGRKGIDNLIGRNEYLSNEEFSTTLKLRGVEGGREVTRETRVFNEDGIYEVTMLAGTDNAKTFRAWIRGVLKALRKGEVKLVSMTEYQRMIAETRAENAKIRKVRELRQLADKYKGKTYEQVLDSYASKELTGEHIIPLPQLAAKTYSATEIGERLGISSNMVGILTNRHNLKTNEYGGWFNDKAKGHSKEVQSFRYYENVIPVLEAILKQQSAS